MDIGSIQNSQYSGQGAMAQISVAITQQIQASQEMMGNALVGMIEDTTRLSGQHFKQSGLGEFIDISI